MGVLPDWPTCVRGSDPVCTGIRVGQSGGCLAHLDPAERTGFLRTLEPGGDLALSGTTLSQGLLDLVLSKVRNVDGRPELRAADFRQARFGRADLTGLTVDSADFGGAGFGGAAVFTGARFGEVTFTGARFLDVARFDLARFTGTVGFERVLARGLDLSDAEFARPAVLALDTGEVVCDRTRFSEGVAITVRRGTLSAERTVFGAASTIAGVIEPTERRRRERDRRDDGLRLLSLRGSDVSELVLTDVDLRECAFTGAHRLDQLRVDGRRRFARPPGWWRTTRQVLHEEAVWRGWTARPRSEIGATQVSVLYRALRKSFEDSKNEAGAGDFYYGEMELRRHSTQTRRAERAILLAYWALSGYGQRAGRAVVALLALIVVTAVLLGVGGQPPGEAAQIAVGAVVLREPGARLSEAGQWTVMVARVLGPLLLALAALAVRARVKR